MKALVLAAGEGTRMRPLTATTPKPLLLVAGRPFLEHALLSLKEAGVTEVILLTGWMEDRLREHFKDGSHLGVRISYLEQKERRGTGHAVGMAAGELSTDFLCLNGDTVVTAEAVKRVLAFAREHPGNVMGLAEAANPREYGVVTLGPGGAVRSIEEKPDHPAGNLVNAGLYVFTPEIFAAIERTPPSPRGEHEITDALRALASEGRVFGTLAPPPWLDIGRPWDLLRANELLLEGMERQIEGEVEAGAVLKGPVRVGDSTIVRAGSYIEGPVSIGRKCDIGPHCFIRPSTTIGDFCKVGAGTELKNSIVMSHSHVPHLNYVGDSLIGERCNLGAGTIVANLRLDEKSVSCTVRGERVPTGRRKLGVIMGDNVKTGINCTIDAGTVIGENSFIGPGARVKGFVEPFSWVL